MATKQDIIREGLFKVLFPHSNADHYTGDPTVQKVLEYIHSRGVVLKVERELPKLYDDEHPDGFSLPIWCTEAYKRAGYVATEPLIEKKEIPLSELPKFIYRKP